MTRTQPTAVPNAAPTAALAALANELAGLLERETALVRAMKIAEIEPLQPDKARLTQRFDKEFKAATASGDAAARGPAAAPWLAAGHRLAAAAMANERALRIGRAATERLVGAVVSAVQQSRSPATGYSKARCVSRAQRIAGVAIDHRL